MSVVSKRPQCLANRNDGCRCSKFGVKDLSKPDFFKSIMEKLLDRLCVAHKNYLERQVCRPTY